MLRPKVKNPYLSHELVTEILSWLPVKSLLRFRSVCKAWRSTISDDPSFVLAHLRHQRQRPLSLLILPIMGHDDYGYGYHYDDDTWKLPTEPPCRRLALFRWAPPRGFVPGGGRQLSAARLVHAVNDVRRQPPQMHNGLAHCDGLVLVPTRQRVLLFNPALRQAAALPWSPGGVAPRCTADRQPAYGLGRDPRSGAYKVARFFYREVYVAVTGTWGLATGVEVFAVGGGRGSWREAAAQPPYPVVPERTATFHEGSASLLWTIDTKVPAVETPPAGFLRFSLEDETFGVTPAPPPMITVGDGDTNLSELRGHLCVARLLRSATSSVLELWMSEDAVHPRWELRHAIRGAHPRTVMPRPVAVFDDGSGIVFHGHDGCWAVWGYHFETRAFQEIAELRMLRYRHPGGGDLRGAFYQFFLVPYHDSFISLE